MVNQELIDLSYNVVLKDEDDHLKVENQDIKVEDLQFMLAESIERLCSGTTPTQEYFSWFEDCADIMSHMNDGYISNADLDERNGWVSYSYTRETEIMTCLALYKSSSYPLAEKKYDFLYNKLVKLRQIRTSIIESTVGTSDEKDRKNKETEKKDDNEYLKYMSSMSNIAKNTITWNLPVSELQDLRIYHGDDYDLAGEYEYFYGQLEPHPETLALPEARTKYAFEKDLYLNNTYINSSIPPF